MTLQRLYDLCWVCLLDYTRSPRFFFEDLGLGLSYLAKGPYAVSKSYLVGEGASDLYTYGETPIAVMRKIAKAAKITADDVVYELGCGTGRTCAWLHHRIGCKVVGIERIPTFVQRARRILRGPTFIEGDYQSLDLSDATVIYLYNFDELPPNLPTHARLITVHPVSDKTLSVRFPWGKTDLYLTQS